MPEAVQVQSSERVDAVDLRQLVAYPRELTKLLSEQVLLDRQSRILRGFRVQLTDQNMTPGRITVHCGTAFDRSGRLLINETQGDATRTVTLEGANTYFYVELEFIESDAAVDSRAFWDPTVDQGADPSGDEKPDGQEFSNNIATRKSSDWRIVQPVSTTNFERDLNPGSTRIPLIRLKTDASNKITAVVNSGLTTEKFATTLLEQVSTTKIRVQNSRYMARIGNDIKVSEGATTEETVTVSGVDYESGVVSISTLSNVHSPGDVVRVITSSEPDFITEADYGRYHRPVATNPIDYRDRVFQGDEVHGAVLSRGHGSITQRSSVNLQSLTDYVDYLAAQIQEMKWGVLDPYASGSSTARIPPGLSGSFPSTPRHYDRAGGILGSRTAAVTVGDGVNSFGDFNGTTQAVLQVAHDALPAAGGRIFLKRGTYGLTADFDITNTGEIVLEGESGTVIELRGGRVHLQTTGAVAIKNLTIKEGTVTPSNYGIMVSTFDPIAFTMTDVAMIDAAFVFNSIMPPTSFFTRVYFIGTSANMSTIPLMKTSGPSGIMSGTFAQCNFYHYTFNALTTSLIDFITGAPTTSCANLNFVDCEFGTTWLNSESIHLGNTVNIVQFDRCFFYNLLTLCHIRATGGANVKLTNCVSGDPLATFAHFSGMSHVTVDGYLNNNSVGLPAVELINCSHAKIMNCDVQVNSGASLVNVAIHVAASADVDDVEILNNIIRGDVNVGFNKAMAIKIDQTGGVATYFTNLKINGNTIKSCEVPIYLANSGTSSFYRDVEIADNTLVDWTAYTTVTMKIGILFGSSSTREGVVISNNMITGLAPATNDVTGASASRAGICISGTGNTQFVIEGNVIQYSGYLLNALTETAGIYIVGIDHSTISDNVIKNIVGTDAYGIKFSQSVSYTTISSNKIEAILGTTSPAYGIYAHNLTSTAIVGNEFSNIATTGVMVSAAVIGCSSGSASWVNATITGNNAYLNSNKTGFALIDTLSFGRSTVSGNTCHGTSRIFLEHNTAGGGSFNNITISGNTGHGMDGVAAIRIDARSGATKTNTSINGNTFHVTSTSAEGIVLLGISMFSVTGNMVYCASPGYVFYASDCLRFAVTGNVFSRAIDLTQNTININTGCNYYTVQGNVCDQGGGTTTSSIDTSLAAQTGNARVSDNLIDYNPNIGTDVVAAANTGY